MADRKWSDGRKESKTHVDGSANLNLEEKEERRKMALQRMAVGTKALPLTERHVRTSSINRGVRDFTFFNGGVMEV